MDLLGIALDGLGRLRVVSPRTVLPHTTRSAQRITPRDAARIARTVGAGAFVVGNVISSGTRLVVRAELYKTRNSRRIGQATVRGMLAEPSELIDSLATALVKQQLVGTPSQRPLDYYGTASPAALRAYLVAEQLMRRGQWQPAADSLRKTIERDSSFVLAWYQLLRTFWWGHANTGFDNNDPLIVGARRDPMRLSHRVALILRAIEAADRGQRLEALRYADELLSAFADDPEAVLVAADNYYHFGLPSGVPPAELIGEFKRAIELDPNIPESRMHLVDLYCLVGDTSAAWQTQARLLGQAPYWEAARVQPIAMRLLYRGEDPHTAVRELPVTDLVRNFRRVVDFVLRCGDAEPRRAIAVADSFAALAAAPDEPRPLRIAALSRRYMLLVAQGRYQMAWSLLQQAAAMDERNLDVQAQTVVHWLITGDKAFEARTAAAGLKDVRPGLWLWYQAAVGRLDSAENAVHAQGFLTRPDQTPLREAFLAGLHGLRYLRDGDTTRSRQLLRQAYAYTQPLDAGVYRQFTVALARIEKASGDLQSANRRLSDMILHAGLYQRAEAEELRGQIEEQRADTAAAIRAYRNFVALWQNADPELQPRVAVARSALVRLERQ